MGYGQPHNTVKDVATPLYARAMVIKDQSGNHILLVHLEQAFVSMAIKEEILARLQKMFPELALSHKDLLMTAQHTHSAPGGYSHYPFYNFTIPGFQTKVFETICSGIMNSLTQAFKDLTPGRLHWGSHEVAAEKEVAFNRSLSAYLSNEDAPALQKEDSHLAINREMEGLFFTTSSGDVKAFINWFGVHGTSISSFNHRIHHDNKGIAAALYEKHHPGITAFFLQSAAGDVSPNFIWDPLLKRSRGKFQDQYESASFNGEIQFRESEKISKDKELRGSLRSLHRFFDMKKAVAPAAHGVSFFRGTREGPGVGAAFGTVLKLVARTVKKNHLIKNPAAHEKFYAAHYPKDVLLDHRSGSFLGLPLSLWKKLPPIPDATVEDFRKSARSESINTLPWVPEILPFQIITLGPLLIAAVPGEITTMAAKRLKDFILKRVESTSVEQVIITSYANAYMGYVTTPEEYFQQCYEGGHTIYGHGTLRGIFEGFEGLLEKLQHPDTKIDDLPTFQFPNDELARRSFS